MEFKVFQLILLKIVELLGSQTCKENLENCSILPGSYQKELIIKQTVMVKPITI